MKTGQAAKRFPSADARISSIPVARSISSSLPVARNLSGSQASHAGSAHLTKWVEDLNAQGFSELAQGARANSAKRNRSSSAASFDFDCFSGFAVATIFWCFLFGASIYFLRTVPQAAPTVSMDSLVRAAKRARVLNAETVSSTAAPQSLSPSLSIHATSTPSKLPVNSAIPEPVATTGSASESRSDYARRFTDMNCFMHDDESELCIYENAICYDGERIVLSVPKVRELQVGAIRAACSELPHICVSVHLQPPRASVGSNELGHVMRDTTANCYDFRYYDPEAIEYTNCR
jgi:hypothetical protein